MVHISKPSLQSSIIEYSDVVFKAVWERSSDHPLNSSINTSILIRIITLPTYGNTSAGIATLAEKKAVVLEIGNAAYAALHNWKAINIAQPECDAASSISNHLTAD